MLGRHARPCESFLVRIEDSELCFSGFAIGGSVRFNGQFAAQAGQSAARVRTVRGTLPDGPRSPSRTVCTAWPDGPPEAE
jgi:hypothetical protein